jgi:C4-dicarboxylate-binding protein DctP
MKFYEVQKYMTLTGHAYHTYAAVMNKQAWESLPEDLQTVIADAMIVGRDAARQFTNEDEAKTLDAIKDQIEIQSLSDEGRAAFIEASKPIYDEFRDKVTPALMDKAIALAKGE